MPHYRARLLWLLWLVRLWHPPPRHKPWVCLRAMMAA
jgi:hypothetical protein